MGEIKGQWLLEEQKLAILETIQSAKDAGVTETHTCSTWRINRRRVDRWRKALGSGDSLANKKPGPLHPPHRLLSEEKEAVLEMAKDEKYVDLSHRALTVTGWEEERFFVSFSSVQRILSSEGLMTMRGNHRFHNGRSIAPVRKELTGPNQRWCWDISYLRTFTKGVFLYLYLLIDEYSRKEISWLVSWHLSADEAQRLIEGGLINENILDLPEDQRPEVINDRGRQMKAKVIQQMFKDNQMPQIFARPRTPNDNPYIEAVFGTIKGMPEYPGRFIDQADAQKYFGKFFPWYNTDHFHSGIDYVTPDQCHQGLREEIVTRRRFQQQTQRAKRKAINRARLNLINLNPDIEVSLPAESIV